MDVSINNSFKTKRVSKRKNNKIPKSIRRLTHLRSFHFDNKNVSKISNVIFELKNLKVISFGFNQIFRVPKKNW